MSTTGDLATAITKGGGYVRLLWHLTLVGIACAAYKRHFSEAPPFVIRDTARFRAIARHLAALQHNTSRSEVNVRAKAVLFYNDRSRDTLCMGQFISVYRGRNVRASMLLYQLPGVRAEE